MIGIDKTLQFNFFKSFGFFFFPTPTTIFCAVFVCILEISCTL